MKCIICQKEFEAATKKQRFCSNSCRQKNYRKEIKEMIAEIRLKKAKIKPIFAASGNIASNTQETKEKPAIVVQNNKPEPPKHLKGIDLTIWKSENWK